MPAITELNTGTDGNRIIVQLVYVFGAGTVSVAVTEYDYNTWLIVATIGFSVAAGGTNSTDAAIAAAIQSAASSIVTASGVTSHALLTPPALGMAGGYDDSALTQLYSAGVAPPPVGGNYVSAGGALANAGNYAAA